MTPRPVEARGASKVVVVSAVNLVEGGTLTVLRDCLAVAAKELPPDWRIVALVHDAALISEPRVELREFRSAKRSWLRRLALEWVGFRRLSRELVPDLWLSLHDITPRVVAVRQVVYCHNPAPFRRFSLRDARLEPKTWLFSKLYHLLYGAFIHRNDFVIVQQEWLREAFRGLYGPLPLIVAHPSLRPSEPTPVMAEPKRPLVFLYPALPRVHKVFETLCEAVERLERLGILDFEVRLTIDGAENRYSRWLLNRYGNLSSLRFIGLQDRGQMTTQYEQAAIVVFPSELETWGLPISEAKAHAKPLMVSDLPYAHESVGTYAHVDYFPAGDSAALAELMQLAIEGRWRPRGSHAIAPVAPFANDWSLLWKLLVAGL